MNRFFIRYLPYRPLSVCFTAIRILLLTTTFVSGLWSERAAAAGDVAFVPVISTVHGVSGMLFSILVICRIWNTRKWLAGLLEDPDCWRQQATQHVFPFCMALFACAVVSGVAIALGCLSSVAFHVGVGIMLCLVSVIYAVLNAGR